TSSTLNFAGIAHPGFSLRLAARAFAGIGALVSSIACSQTVRVGFRRGCPPAGVAGRARCTRPGAGRFTRSLARVCNLGCPPLDLPAFSPQAEVFPENSMRTAFANAATVRRDWYLVDATGKTLGRLASQVAARLRGKHKAAYT